MCKDFLGYTNLCGIWQIPESSAASKADGLVEFENQLQRHRRCKMSFAPSFSLYHAWFSYFALSITAACVYVEFSPYPVE